MKPLNSRILKPLFSGVFPALLFAFALPGTSHADTFIGAGSSEIRKLRPGDEVPPTEVFDVDTDTGVRSNIQKFSSRGPAFLTAMDRDSSGTLWGINEPNRLVSIDEATGIVTDVVELTHPTGSIRGIPAMAFVPGAEDTLYAIVRFEGMDRLAAQTKADILDGFHLVEVDTTTGIVTPTYPILGGRYGNGLAHGLEFDDTYGLVHMWSGSDNEEEFKVGVEVGISVELLDPVNETSEPIAYSGPPPYEPLKTNSGFIPDGFQATVHSGRAGVIYVYQGEENIGNFPETKVSAGSSLLSIEILDDDGDLSYTTCFEGDVISGGMTMPIYSPFSQSRAMELTGDSSAILIDFGGVLTTFASEPIIDLLEAEPKGADEVSWYSAGSVMTSIGGYAPQFESLATDPVSGLVLALSSRGVGIRPMAAAGLEKANEKELMGGAGVGLNIIDRNGPVSQELDGFDIPLTDPGALMMSLDKEIGPMPFSPLTQVEAIAFDDAGVLYGIADGRNLVIIDLPSGEVSPVEGFNRDLTDSGYGYQLEFNPADGKLYILFYGYSFESRPSGWRLVSVNRDGSNPVSTPVTGLSGGDPTSLVTAGPNSFVFAAQNLELSSFKTSVEEGVQFFGLGSDGSTTLPFAGSVNDLYISALTQIPFVQTSAIPDVLIGKKRDSLQGNNIYNPNAGPAQTIRIRARSKKLKGDFFAEVQNDGQTAALFNISARGGKKSDDIRYLSNLGNITADVKRGLVTTLGPGRKIAIRVKFSRDGKKKFKEKFRIQAIAGGRADAATAKVKIKQPRAKRPVKPENLF